MAMSHNNDNEHGTSFSSMPTEIVEDIFQYLPRKEKTYLRLMNHQCNAVVSETLFQFIVVKDTSRSMLQLKNIASSPFWARQVREILWHICLDEEIFTQNLAPGNKIHHLQSDYLSRFPNVRLIQFPPRTLFAIWKMAREMACETLWILCCLMNRAKPAQSTLRPNGLSIDLVHTELGQIK